MIDRRFVGHALPAFDVPVEAGRLRFFAQAIGEADPVYTDGSAARDAGHPGLPVPPTFLFCLEMAAPDPAAMRKLLAIDYRHVLHGEQHFRYHAPAHAGDRLHFEPRIGKIYDKKGGVLEFVRRDTAVTNQHGALVAELSCLTVVRHPQPLADDTGAPAAAAGLVVAPCPAAAAPAEPAATIALPRWDDLQVGAELPPLAPDPVSRLTLALYCGASGDHNPIHVDIDYARAAGQRDVFAHGMLSAAYLGRLLTNWVPQRALKSLSVRFVAITQVGDALVCRATVAEKLVGRNVRLALSVRDGAGAQKLAGEAVVELA